MEAAARAEQWADPPLVDTQQRDEGAFDHGALMQAVDDGR